MVKAVGPVDQVKTNGDGTQEASGNLRLENLPGFLAVFGLGSAEIENGLEILKKLGPNPPFYFKVRAGVENNQAKVGLLSAQIGRLTLPLEKLPADEAATFITNLVIARIPGLEAKKVTFENGQMNFEGAVPEKMSVEK